MFVRECLRPVFFFSLSFLFCVGAPAPPGIGSRRLCPKEHRVSAGSRSLRLTAIYHGFGKGVPLKSALPKGSVWDKDAGL